VHVLDDFTALARALDTLTSRFDPSTLDGPAARDAVRCLAEIERVAGAAKVLATARLVETGAGPGDDSFRDVDAWLASLSGTSVAAARGVVETARRVQRLPETADALRAGDLSPTQASAVTSAAQADPNAETRLLEIATTCGVKGLRAECDRVVAAATSRRREVDAYERVRVNRALRVRSLPDGSRQLEARGPADRVAQVMAALEPFERQLFETARATKQIEHPEATAFDALVALAERSARGECAPDDDAPVRSGRRGGRPLAMVVLHVSKDAYERGWTERGERCEIEGVGPVPVGVARRLADDCIMKAVVTDGVDITRVAHLGRSVPAHLRTAVETRDRVCVIEGCEVERHLEIDHNIPFALGGPATLENLGACCHHHHDLKTRRDLRRVGPLGRQRLVTREEFDRLRHDTDRGPPVLVG
jgi:hypothetical protein